MYLYSKFKTPYLLLQIAAEPEKGSYFRKLDDTNVTKHRVRSYNIDFFCQCLGLRLSTQWALIYLQHLLSALFYIPP
jgi:hypothetical protein